MIYEVEQKFRVDGLGETSARLGRIGAIVGPAIVESDVYFAHPVRDFAETDEALRLRTRGGCGFLTYKGPRLDSTLKTRLELELPLPGDRGVVGRFAELFALLGFDQVITVRKNRRTAELTWDGVSVLIALDDVDELGTFVEVETTAEGDGVDAAQRLVADVAAALELSRNERASYCELLLQRTRSR